MTAGQKLMQAVIVNWNINVKQGINELGSFNARSLEKELTQNKQLMKITSGDDEGNSSGSDSEPSADNMDDEEMSKIVPAIKIVKKPPPKKEEIKKVVPPK